MNIPALAFWRRRQRIERATPLSRGLQNYSVEPGKGGKKPVEGKRGCGGRKGKE